MLVFFFYGHAAHRDLHSFPTRRSSDLLLDDDPFDLVIDTLRHRHPSMRGLPRGRLRSEEHTSELQSRGHLVCRLLLEKKNKRVSSTTARARATAWRPGSTQPSRWHPRS